MEEKHKISPRWTRENEYKRLIHSHNRTKQLKLVYQMQAAAAEKDFLYGLRRKYSGRITDIISFINGFEAGILC